jgi:hypothetical protein
MKYHNPIGKMTMNLFKYFFVITLLFLSKHNEISFSDERPTIKASDVVFMYPANPPSKYDAFHGTVAGWGGRPSNHDEGTIKRFQQRVEEAHKRGLRYCASVDFLVDFKGMIDFRPDTFEQAICRDLDNNPITVPWLWDHTYKGHSAYWFCFNNPDVQAFYKDQAKRACKAPIDGLHIDDYAGTSHCSEFRGGCFCPYCMDGFREYLSKNYSNEKLKNMEINDIRSFNYKTFLLDKKITAEQFRKSRWKLPLGNIFQDFQNECMKERITAVYEYAEQLRGKPLVRSINSHASSPRTVIPAPIIDYFCGEVGQNAASKKISTNPIFVYRMVEILGDRQTATASGQDWAWIKANNKPRFVRTWIAQAYAFGSVFMVPHNQWCYTQDLGTHWWQGDPKDFADIYKFVRNHAYLLDGFNNDSSLAAIITDADFSSSKKEILELAKSNIPFSIQYYADGLQTINTQIDELAKYQYILCAPAIFRELKKYNELASKVSYYNQIDNKLSGAIKIENSDKIVTSLRKNQENKQVCHLLNQNYDSETDSIIPSSCTIRIPKELIDTNSDTVRLYRIDQKSIEIPLKKTNNEIAIEIKNLGLWGILEFNPTKELGYFSSFDDFR